MSDELTRLPVDMLMSDEEYRKRIQAKFSYDAAEDARLGAAPLATAPKDDPVASMRHVADWSRAEAAVHKMDLGQKVGPDAVQQRLQKFERTADPTGQTPVGLPTEERRRRMEALSQDERLLSFFEQNPEANFFAADDTSFFEGVSQLVRDAVAKPAIIAGGFQRSRLAEERGDLFARAMVTSDPAERAQLMADAKRLTREIAATPNQPKSGFDRMILETIGGMADTMIVDPLEAGIATTRVTVPLTLAAGAVGGAALFGAPSGGVGAVPGAAIGASTLTAIVTPIAFGVGAVGSMWKRSTGTAYGDYVEAGEDPDALSTKLASIAYGTVETAIEFAGAKIQWNAFGKPLAAKFMPDRFRNILSKEALDYFRNPSRLKRAGAWLAAAAKGSGAEASEEFAQSIFSNAVGDAVLRSGQGAPLGQILDEVFSELPANALQGAQEGASVFASMMLTAGLFAPIGAYRAHKEVSAQEADEDFFNAWADAEQNSTLIQRSPRLAGEFLNVLAEGTDRSTLYVDPDILQGALNSEAIPEREANAVMPDITSRIARAKAEGRRVAIPAKEFATVVSNSKLMPHIRPHLTSTPAGLTNEQRKEQQKKSMEELGLADLAKEKDGVLAVQAALDESAGEVGMRVAEQLAKTGFRDEKTAELEGMSVRNRVRALAAQVSEATGRLYTPEEVFAIYPLNVLSKEQVAAIRAGKVQGAATLGPEVDPLSQERRQAERAVRVQEPGERPATNLPVGAVERAFLDQVAERGREGLTTDVLAGLPGAPKARGIIDIEQANLDIANSAIELGDQDDATFMDRARELFRRISKRDRAIDLRSLDENVRPTPFSELLEYIEVAQRESGGQRDWYKQFGEGIERVVGRANLHEASIIFGITSAQNATWQNLKDTLRVMAAARKFDPATEPEKFKAEVLRKDDRGGIKISGPQLDRIVSVYQTGTYRGGLKVSVYMNLTRDRAKNVFNPFTVQDVHMARVFGYRFRDVKEGKTGRSVVDAASMPSADAIRYSMLMTEQLAQHTGLAPDEVQALLWFYAKNHLSPRKKQKTVTEFVEGSWEEAEAQSRPEIEALQRLEQEGKFDRTRPFNAALGAEVPASFGSDVKSDPWSTDQFAKELDELAMARAPRVAVSANPGQGRGYGFPLDTPLSELNDYQRRVLAAITDQDGQIRVLRRLGINHAVQQTFGTFDRVEPSLSIAFPGESFQTALFASRLLGDALLQDASITTRPDFEGQEFAVRLRTADGSAMTADTIERLYSQVNPDRSPDGLNFTVDPDGRSLVFMDGRRFGDGDYTAQQFEEFLATVSSALADGFLVADAFAVESQYDGSEVYEGRGREGAPQVWNPDRPAGGPDLQSALRDELYEPVWREYGATVRRLGITPRRTDGPLGQPLPSAERVEADERSRRTTEVLDQLVYHGTPAFFKKFDISFLGTGEGAQAFGWGLYFTSSQGIARFYREKMTSRELRFRNTPVSPVNLHRELQAFGLRGEELAAAAAVISEIGKLGPREVIEQKIREYQDRMETSVSRAGRDRLRDRIDALRALNPDDFSVARGGMLAAVHIPDDHDLAVWELPISKQDPKVREGIKRAITEVFNPKLVQHLIKNDVAFEQVVMLADTGREAQQLSESLAANGVLGHSYEAQTRTRQKSDAATNYVIYDDKAISEVVEILDSAGRQASDGPRARIALKEKEAYAAVLSASDLTGFQHELAHWYLQQLVVFRQLGLSSDQMNADLDTVVRWTGADSWEHLTRPFVDRFFQGKADKPHELFARGFEVFLAEGRAPTPEMEGIFYRFRAWVRQAYGGLRQTREILGIELNDEIRGVYDRLFLVEAAVEEAGGDLAEPLLTDKPDTMTDAQWAAYQKAWVRHKNAAFTQVTRRHLPTARRRMREQLGQAMDLFRQEAEQQYAADPGWAAIEFLKRDEGGMGLDRQGLLDLLGTEGPGLVEALLAKPGQGRGRKLVVADGLDPEWAAESLGFASAGDMVEAMLQARTVDQLVQERVNREIENNDEWSEEAVLSDAEAAAGADREALALVELAHLRQMAEGAILDEARAAQAATGAPSASDARSDVALAEGALSDAIAAGASEQAVADLQALVLNARAAQTAAAEGRKAARVAGQTLRGIEERLRAGVLRSRARQLVADVKAGDLKKERTAWNKAGSQAAQRARKALAARKFQDAAVDIERQLLADYAVAEINRAIDESAKGWRLIDRLKKGKNLDKLRAPGFDGAAQIVKLFQRYDLRKTRPGRPDGQTALGVKLERVIRAAQAAEGVQTLAEFVKEGEERYLETLAVPDWLLKAEADTRHWSTLPISEFLSLIDVIRNIETASKQEVLDIRTREKVSIENAVDQIEQRMLAVNDLRKDGKSSRPNPLSVQAIRDLIRWADSMLLRVVDWIDFAGGDDIQNNSLRKFVFDGIDQGEHDYIDASKKYTQPWLDAMDKLDWSRMNREVDLEGVENPRTPSRVRIYEIMMWKLHSGTESNLHRRDEGYANNAELSGWTPNVMEQAIAKHLTDADLAVVQQIWDAFEGLRSIVFEHHFQMTGNRPVQLERREHIAHTGRKMTGGYMPAKYWSKYSKRAQALNDKADVEGMFGHNFVKAEVEHGHVKTRAANYSAPLDTNIGVIASHLDSVIYDLTMRRAVRDAYKIVNHPRFEDLVRKTWGPEYHEALKKMVHDAARVKSARPTGGWRNAEKLNSWARSSVIYSGLAYRISTGIVQITGLGPVFSEVGPTYALMAIANSVKKGAWGLVKEVRASSRVLQHRGVTKDRELREMLSRKQDRNSLKARIDANTGVFIVIADAVVSSIAWDAQRMKSMAEHGDMARAIREADRAIERTQGSSTIAGASQLMRAEGFARWLTLFGSFTSNIYARTRRAGRMAVGLQAVQDVKGAPVRRAMPAAATWMLISTVYVPAMLDALIRGEGPDEEDEEPWLSWSAKRFVSLLFSPLPGVSQAVDGMLFPHKRAFVGKSPTSRMFEVPVKIYDELQAVFLEDDQFDPEKLTLLAMQGLTMARVAPLSQPEIWVDNFWPGEEMGSPRDLIWRKPRDRRE